MINSWVQFRAGDFSSLRSVLVRQNARRYVIRCSGNFRPCPNFEKDVAVLFNPSHIIVYPSSRSDERQDYSTSSQRKPSFGLTLYSPKIHSIAITFWLIVNYTQDHWEIEDDSKSGLQRLFVQTYGPGENAGSSYNNHDCGVGDKIYSRFRAEP